MLVMMLAMNADWKMPERCMALMIVVMNPDMSKDTTMLFESMG